MAAQLYTVRDRLGEADQRRDVLSRLREIGYEAVEVASLDRAAAERFDEELRAARLTACAAHVGLERLTAELDTVAAECVLWGCSYVVVPSLPTSYHSLAGFEKFARECREMAAALRPFGLELAYHNHDFEFERWDGRTGLEILFDAAPHDALKSELDTYWIEYAGGSAASWIRRMAGRAPLVHLKDMSRAGGKAQPAELGNGSLDWRGILAACAEAGTTWLVVEQDECAGDPLDSLAISYRNLARLLA